MVESPSDAPAYYIVSPSESDIYRAVGNWLLTVLPMIPQANVMVGQSNQMAAPSDPFAVMLIILRERLAANGWTYDGQSTRTITDLVKLTMQVSVFGKATSNQMEAVTTLWRDMSAVEFFNGFGVDVCPLYTSKVRQLGFINGEKQYEDCWTVDLTMQANITISIPQDFADEIVVTPISVDAEYPATTGA